MVELATNHKDVVAKRIKEEQKSQHLEKELEVERYLVECNTSITQLQETQLMVYKTQLEEMTTLKD